MKKRLLMLTSLLLATAGAFAQTATGNVFGNVTDTSGAVLPGATVSISGEAGTRSTVTGSDGSFRFLNMDYGDYKVSISLQGFGTASRKVTVVTGSSAQVTVSLAVGGLTDTVEVSGEAPLVDIKKRGTSTTLNFSDLKDTPNSRDPWGIMNQVPGALIDRVNIAGNENGQQASVAGKGSAAADRVWSLDGLVVTDMSATGASPTYFDFDAFQEINVTTGGGDLTMQTGGFGMNLVTKRGTNAFHGGGRFLATDEKWESSNIAGNKSQILIGNANRLKGGVGHCDPGAGERDKANYIDSIKDYGFDLGGPVIKDKLWFYGTYGKQDIKLCGLSGSPDDTLLPSYNFKLNWQASSNTMVSAFYFLGSKQKLGRSPGTGRVEEDGILWNQDNAFTDGGLPGGLSKLEINHTFSPSFFMSAKAAYYDTGFGLVARGDKTKSYTYDDVAGTAIGTYVDFLSVRPQKTANVDGSYFRAGMGGNHELKFGFSYRDVTTNSSTTYNGNGLVGQAYAGPGTGGGGNIARIYRDGVVEYGGKYSSVYLGDVFTKNRLTVNAGARFDRQTARNLGSEAAGNKSFANLLPALKFSGSTEDNIAWSDISPRVGMSYALDESRKTVLRASFARYAEQLSYGNVAGSTGKNPVAASYLAYGWDDLNGDRFVQPGEVLFPNFIGASNVDPNNPGAVGSTPNQIDKDLKSKKDNEFVLGVDRELASDLAVGAALTYRKSTDSQYTPRLAAPCPTGVNCAIIGPSDYTANAPVTRTIDGRTYTAQTYSANPALVAAGGFGRYRTNQDGYSTVFKGLEVTLNKRMANKWRARVALSLNDWTDQFDGTPVSGNPNNAGSGNPTRQDIAGLEDGGQVSVLGGGSGKAAFYSSFKWQIFASAGVTLPASFDLSASFFGRQGGILPVILRVGAGSDGTLNALTTGAVDSERYAALKNLDLRLARNARLGRVTVTPSVELFNVFNSGVVLGVFRQATSANFRRVDDLLSPRIVRIGARVSF
ncbi:MAG: TonB-dependent receptor [Vicinamibacteria bacterium]|nr:TonB-dependent receptor [Vicinamibacteria bacterium]